MEMKRNYELKESDLIKEEKKKTINLQFIKFIKDGGECMKI